jgi:flagellar hook-associated protein 3 FlgL
MRISTVTMFEQSVSSMNRQQSEFLKISQQMATGRRVVNPSDDPQAASRALGVSQSMAVTQQYMDARVMARNTLSQTESVLNSVSDGITSAKTLMIQAANGTLSDADRQSIASELNGIYQTMIGLANTTDGNGNYLFGGYRNDSAPFNADGNVEYVGDPNTQALQVDATRKMPIQENGITVFMSVPNGTGYVAEANPGNGGTLTFNGPSVTNASHENYANGAVYAIEFQVDGETTTYTISNGDTTSEPMAYTPGQSVELGNGRSIKLSGVPADGDSVSVGPAEEMNTSVFASFEKALAVLNAPIETPADQAAFTNALNTVMRELDNSLDNVLTVRASIGARLNELDVLDTVGNNRMLNYTQTHSDLVDLDYNQAISEYALRQVGLQAAQQTFVGIQGLSLFNYM